MQTRPKLSIIACILLGLLVTSPSIRCLDGEDLKIPDPFSENENKQGYFAIDSYQVSSSHRHSARIDVTEYFSLKTGVSYSIQSDKDDRSADPLLIVVDGLNDKSYIVSNYNSNQLHWNKTECEVDHEHSHRQIFPWQYEYSSTKKGAPSFIYGVGAIWLNAIREQQQQQESRGSSNLERIDHPSKNAWKMSKRGIEVELMFDKVSGENNQDYSSKTRLDSIYVTKNHSVMTDRQQNTYAVGIERKEILVSRFRYIGNVIDDHKLLDVTSMIGRCRRQAKDRQLFPNLLAAVSSSPKRMFMIDYMQTTYPAAKEMPSGSFDDARHRYVFEHEYRTEWFSFQKEMSSITYVALDEIVLDKLNQQHTDRTDTFTKRFTDRVMSRDPRGPSTVSYHLVGRADGLAACFSQYHDEPVPKEHYLVRPVHFYTRKRTKVSGLLTGLGALIMNAADSHHMQFNLYKKIIDVVQDPANIQETVRVEVNEWRMYDKATKRVIKFFFKLPGDGRTNHQINDLVRIDIYKMADFDQLDSTDTKGGSGGPEQQADSGLMYRYDIFEIDTEVSAAEIEMAFELPQECFKSKTDEQDSDSEMDDDDEDDNDKHSNYDDDSDTDDSDSDEDDEDDFEFNPGNLVEHMQFPKLFNYLDGRAVYAIESEIDTGADTKFLLKERVDMESEQAIFSIVSVYTGLLMEEFHINYKSELIFRIAKDRCTLIEGDDISESRFFKSMSGRIQYFRSLKAENNNATNQQQQPEGIVKSDKLRSYGVGSLWRLASESEFIRYDGFTTVFDEKGESKFKEMIWTLEKNDRQSDEISFVFQYDVQQHKRNHQLKLPNRSVDLMRLARIDFNTSLTRQSGVRGLAIELKSIDYPVCAHLMPQNWSLPAVCANAKEEAAKRLEKEYEDEDVTIPSLMSVIKERQVYTMRYVISHSPLDGPHDPAASGTSGLPILESFDLNAGRGKLAIGIGLDKRLVFIEGESSFYTYFERTNDCKRLSALNNLVDLGNNYLTSSNIPGQPTLYGLGALWNRLARAQNSHLEIQYRVDERGFHRQTRTYRFVTTHTESHYQNTEFLIRMVFVEDYASAESQMNAEKNLKLESIEVIPKSVHAKDKKTSKWNYRTLIQVASFAPALQENLKLPEACERQARLEERSFPSLSGLIGGINRPQFHMRSELTTTHSLAVQSNGNKQMLAILTDEWIYERNYRYRTLNLKRQNFDSLIYGSTREGFDLKFPYQCSWNFWKLTEPKRMNDEEQKNVLDFWASDRTQLLRPSLVNFAPAALWLAAERNPSNVKLLSSIDLAPSPDKTSPNSRQDHSVQQEREMRLVSWQVSSPANEKVAWSYKMTFEEVSASQPDGKLREWHVLDRIELEESDPFGNKFFAEIDVLNYKYTLTQEEIDEKFSLPEAHGCKRDESVIRNLFDARDELQLAPSRQHKILYSASLELADEVPSSGLPRRTTYAPIGGVFYSTGHGGDLGETVQVRSNHQFSRQPDGSTRSSKIVYDKFNSLVYSIDPVGGQCDIRRDEQCRWQLEFNRLDDKQQSSSQSSAASPMKLPKIRLGDGLIELLFLGTVKQDFRPINRWVTPNHWHMSTYELDLERMSLFEDGSPHNGRPAKIVRRFFSYGRRPQLVGKGVKQAYGQRSLETRVYLFDAQDRTKVVGKFVITLDVVDVLDMAEVMRANTIEDCYSQDASRQVGSFELELKIDEPTHFDWLRFNYLHSERVFLLKLMREARVLPTQFVDTPKFHLQERQMTVLIRFRLLDAPTAIEYFQRRLHANMADDLLAASETRLLPSLTGCSSWCDRENCSALSYCSGRVCRILTEANLVEAGLLGVAQQVSERVKSSASDEACDYFYAGSDFKPSSLDQFVQLVRSDLATVPASSSKFGVLLDDQYVMPSEFYDKRTSADELDGGDSPSSMSDTQEERPYMTLGERGVELDIDRIMKTFNTLVFYQANNFGECMKYCASLNCHVASYDADRACCVAIKGDADLKSLLLTKSSERESVSIAVRDHRNEYSRFRDTAMPRAWKRKLADYSAVECASACSMDSHQQCLSFDHCRSGSNPEQDGKALQQESLCFLQDVHVLSDSFDRSLFEPNLERDKREFICEHYSRSVLADFEEMPDKQLAVGAPALLMTRPVSREMCALECRQMDRCWAFEFCANAAPSALGQSESSQPKRSCQLAVAEGRPDAVDADADAKAEAQAQVEAQSTNSSRPCSVFVLRHKLEQLEWTSDEATHSVFLQKLSGLIERHISSGSPKMLLSVLLYLLVAVLVGSFLQFGFIRLAGRSIIFKY